jgi:cytochrome P450
LVPAAVDEVLRFYPPVNRTARVCLAPVTLRGITIPAGSIVVLMLGAGNRDPEAFEAPDVFDVQRRREHRNLSFGSGHHFCIGAHLGKLEAEVALSTILQELPRLRLTDEGPVWRGGSRFRGIESLKVEFTRQGSEGR